MTTDLNNRVQSEILPFVVQPAQYVGGEVNSVLKPWDSVALRFCLAFPDAYTIGISHHGSAALYEILNARPDTLCERTYLPWTDAQELMRAAEVSLWSWESRHPVREFDVLGISLQYELLYTGVLNLLDLSGIPLKSADRTGDDPLVIAGGPGTDNPEPMAPFIDLFLLGDGEEALPAVLDALLELRTAEPDLPRAEQIARLAARFDFLYAPAFYEPSYAPDGRLESIRPTRDDLPETIRAAHVADFDAVPAPVQPIVPFSEGVHERLTIEVMRGCPRRCRFCEAGHTKGKVRLRSPEHVLRAAREGLASTGYEEISLMSLSTSDHPGLREILALLETEFADQQISIALPSLRTNEQLADLPGLLTRGRKSGLTLVPEAATERLRRAINKDVDEEHLEAGARAAFERGWNLLKLYFMVGLPGETDEDVAAIIDLTVRLARLREEFARGPAQINLSVATLIPRPHTPLGWAAMIDEPTMQAKRGLLRDLARRHKFIKLKFHHIERSHLEGILARADRRMAEVILAAYRAGARFDAWNETFDFAIWKAAMDDCGIDAADAHRERPAEECLPWSHINMGTDPASLRRQWDAMQQTLQG